MGKAAKEQEIVKSNDRQNSEGKWHIELEEYASIQRVTIVSLLFYISKRLCLDPFQIV